MEKEMVVEGYVFADEAMAKQARTEAEGVRYVRARTDMSKPGQVLDVYNRLIEQKMFQTPVGYAYLKELSEYLKTMPGVHSEDVHPIPVAKTLVVDDADGVTKRYRARIDSLRQRFFISLTANFVLTLAVILMFLISATSGQATIFNYENKLQDRYARWEQELTEREQQIREREQELYMDTLTDAQ